MGTYTEIQLSEFDDLLKATKGWVRNICGNEYVYDYKMAKFPHLIVKVLSSISVDSGRSRNKGADAIRVFVIRKLPNGQFSGYAKQIRVNRTMNWRNNVKNAFMKQQKAMYAREK